MNPGRALRKILASDERAWCDRLCTEMARIGKQRCVDEYDRLVAKCVVCLSKGRGVSHEHAGRLIASAIDAASESTPTFCREELARRRALCAACPHFSDRGCEKLERPCRVERYWFQEANCPLNRDATK